MFTQQVQIFANRGEFFLHSTHLNAFIDLYSWSGSHWEGEVSIMVTEIKHTLIFNELWKGVCVGNRDKEPEQPTTDKEFAIWEKKKSNAYALIAASVNEEVSRHISSFSNDFEALRKLKELYDSHSALEVVQLMIKLFNLELQMMVLLLLHQK